MCRVSFQPCFPSAAAAAAAASSTSSGTPASSARSVTRWEKALVASSTLSLKRDESWSSRSRRALNRAFCSGGSSAPPRRKSRSSLSTIFLRSTPSAANPRRGADRLELHVQALVLRQLGVVLGDLRQVGVVDLAQLGAVHHRVQMRRPGPRRATAARWHRRAARRSRPRSAHRPRRRAAPARPCSRRCSWSTAGVTCAGWISPKRGRPEKSSNGFIRDTSRREGAKTRRAQRLGDSAALHSDS